METRSSSNPLSKNFQLNRQLPRKCFDFLKWKNIQLKNIQPALLNTMKTIKILIIPVCSSLLISTKDTVCMTQHWQSTTTVWYQTSTQCLRDETECRSQLKLPFPRSHSCLLQLFSLPLPFYFAKVSMKLHQYFYFWKYLLNCTFSSMHTYYIWAQNQIVCNRASIFQGVNVSPWATML